MAALIFSLRPTSLIFFFFAFAQANNYNCDAPDDDHLRPSATLPLMSVHSPCSPFRPNKSLSWSDTVLQMQSNDNARLSYLSSHMAGAKATVPIASGKAITHNPTYVVKVKIGTPPQTLLMAIDTTQDAALVPCAGCSGCSPVAPAYNPAKSTTFKTFKCSAPQCLKVPISYPSCGSGPRNAPCVFSTSYGASDFSATLVQDNITLATESITRYAFGCIKKATGSSIPAQGLLGLGRQSLSLLSQTSKLYKSTFSYCLPSYKSPKFSGSLRLGADNQPKNIQTTPLLVNARLNFYYYANLTGIMVGKKVLNIPSSAFAFNQDTGAGTVFDSGRVYSVLVGSAYTAVRNEIRRKMGKAPVFSLGGFDTCYNVPVKVRTITLMFSGMNMRLPQENFLIHSSSGSTSCLAMSAAADDGINIIGSFQQQNHRVLIDIPNSKIGVAREPCS